MQLLYFVLAGVVFGLANVIPGVSGGTMAVVFGIYERLLSVLSDPLHNIKKEWKFLVTFAIGLAIALNGARAQQLRIVIGGVLAGVGVAAMHYTGMAAMELDGTIDYATTRVGISVGIAVVAAAVALWLAVTVRKPVAILAAAMIKGVEMSAGMRGASNMSDLNENRFHPPAMIGPLGATVASAHLLDLNEMQIRNALGIVTSRCGGSWINVGTHTKCLHCGQASFVGLDSALLASRNYTANPNAFEAERGFIDCFLKWEKFDADILLRYGKRFRIVDPGYEIKIYPSNFGTHAGINAALELRPRIKNIDDIVSIREESVNQPYCNRPYPESGLSGKFSHQYTVVRALLDGFVNLDSFTDESRFEPKVDELLSKYECNMHEDWPCTLNGHKGELVVTLKDGTVLSAVAVAPKGGHIFGSKPVSYEDHYPKLKACLLKGMSADNVD